MRRRAFLAILGGVAWPLAVHAQSTRLVGVLMNGNSNEASLQANLTGLTEGLRDLGLVEGRNLRLEVRWNGGNAERARSFASELIAMKPAAIVSASTTNLLALKNATNSIPIIFLQVSDPVAQGFVQSVTKPGGNATGFSAYEFSIGSKWLDLLRELSPSMTRVVVMVNPDTSPQSKFFMRAIESAAARFKVSAELSPVRSADDIGRVFQGIAEKPGVGMIIPTDSYTRTRGERIAELALKARIPVIAAFSEFVDEGGLMFYGPSAADYMPDQFRQAASYVDRILKGAKPGDLPVQSASKFVLFINRKTSAALGLEIPPKLLFTADKVIE
jgi:putative ABC transport system substrate-binding protein